jgi:hypothetical protein
MEISELVRAILVGDLLTARQAVADAQRMHCRWDALPHPDDLTGLEIVVAAAIVELLAARAGSSAPDWTQRVAGLSEPLILDPGLEQMPRSFAHAKAAGPEPLRRRNLVALPDFLAVA